MAPVSQAPRRYFIEFNAAMLLYIAAAVGRKFVIHYVGDPTLKTLILISPIVPVLLTAWAVVRFYKRMDEYHRLQLLEALAVSAGVTAVVSASWSFLEDAGFPHLQMIDALMVMMLTWGAVALYMGWKDKVSEGRALSALKSVAATLVYVAVGTATYALIMSWAGLQHPWYVLALVATVLFIARMGFFIFSKKSASC